MTYIALALSLIGNVLVIRKSRWGFASWTAANVLWLADAGARRDCAQGALWGVYLALALLGWWHWREESV